MVVSLKHGVHIDSSHIMKSQGRKVLPAISSSLVALHLWQSPIIPNLHDMRYTQSTLKLLCVPL